MRLRNSHLVRCVIAFLLSGSITGLCQTVTLSRSWLPAGTGSEAVTVTLPALPAPHYELLAEGSIGVRWRGAILPCKMVSATKLSFTVPAELRLPGFTEFVLWDMTSNQPLPYRAWLSVIIPTAATVFEGDPASDRLVAFVGADGTGTGTGGQVTVYSLSSGSALRSIDVPPSERVLTFTPDTAFAWIAVDEAQGRLARMNLATGEMDQQIQIKGGTPPHALAAQVYGPDPRILLVSANDGGFYLSLQAFLNGVQLPNSAPVQVTAPRPLDDRGRILLPSGTVCEMSAQLGFTNCTQIFSKPAYDFNTVWKNKGLAFGQVFDLTTGGKLLDAGAAAGRYFQENNRLLLFPGMLIMDADTLEMYSDLFAWIPRGVAQVRTGQADWLLLELDLAGVLAAHIPQLGPAPLFTAETVVNAATFQPGPVAPGEIVSIFGQNLGPSGGSGPVLTTKTQLATQVEDTKVMFGGAEGTILYAGPNQINVVVPETVQGFDSVPLQVVRYGIPSKRVENKVVPYSPAIFGYAVGDKTYAAVLTSDGLVQGPNHPLRRGDQAAFYATGIGLPEGETADSVATRPAEAPVRPSVTIGGTAATVTYAGVSPGLTAGLSQVNVVIPPDAPRGSAVEVMLTVGGRMQRNVWVSVQ